jgi:hypothetical protein
LEIEIAVTVTIATNAPARRPNDFHGCHFTGGGFFFTRRRARTGVTSSVAANPSSRGSIERAANTRGCFTRSDNCDRRAGANPAGRFRSDRQFLDRLREQLTRYA